MEAFGHNRFVPHYRQSPQPEVLPVNTAYISRPCTTFAPKHLNTGCVSGDDRLTGRS